MEDKFLKKINADWIENEIIQNNYKLLGQCFVSQENYKVLLDYSINKVKNIYIASLPKPDLMLSLTLVQIAIRRYEDGKFWKCFQDEINIVVQSSKTNFIGQIFESTIKKFHLFEMKREKNSSQMYVENIKAHAFVTNSYMSGFFDFSYAFYEDILFRELLDDVSEDIIALSEYLSKSDETLSVTHKRAPVKYYKLLKSTRAVFAQTDINVIYPIFYPVLKMIDNYYYDAEIPKAPKNRFEAEFIKWCEAKEKKEHKNLTRTRNIGKIHSHKPYIKVDINNEQSKLVIPSQKFRPEECKGYACVVIHSQKNEVRHELELYKSFGMYISEEIEIPMKDIFSEMIIDIQAEGNKTTKIPQSSYRIFNNTWESIAKFVKGHNYLLIKHGVKVHWSDDKDVQDSYEGYIDWNYFSVNISDESSFYVGNRSLSLMGEFSLDPVFDEIVEGFHIVSNSQEDLTVTRTHPDISFIVDKDRLNGSTLYVNGKPQFIRDIKNKNVMFRKNDHEKLAVTILLDELLKKTDGFYDIVLDIPGVSVKRVCNYILLQKFNCTLDKSRYIYEENGYLTVKDDGHKIKFCNDNWKLVYEEEGVSFVEFPILIDTDQIQFILELDDEEYYVRVPVKVFKFGFSKKEINLRNVEWLWYGDLQDILYVKMPDAVTLGVFWEKEKETMCDGELVEKDLFRMDISSLRYRIKKEYKLKIQYLNIFFKAERYFRITLPIIIRNVIVDPYFQFSYENNLMTLDIAIKGKASLYVDIQNFYSKEVIVSKRELHDGQNVFPELSKDGLYDLVPYMEESDMFGLSVERTNLKSKKAVAYIDMDNLTSCRLQIKDILYDEEPLYLKYTYFVETTKKQMDDTYIGSIFRVTIEERKERWDTKRVFGTVKIHIYQKDEEVKFSLLMYSKDEEEWLEPYYDKKRNYILGCDNHLLDQLTDYDRFDILSEEETEYIVDTSRLRRVH